MAYLPDNSQLDQAVSGSGQKVKIPLDATPTLTTLPNGRTLEKCFSTNGREFTIERPPGDKASDITAPVLALSHDSDKMVKAKADFGMTVDWTRTGALDWKATSKEVQDKAAITQYMLKEHSTDSDGDIHCTLHFTNTEHYGYHFYDHTGDKYWVSTWRNGDHSVGYYSKKPDINYVTGD
ncbi:hypothetical protein F4782DRAFT_17527 [Xylaria castorea]|nr:hypothetical protein F4782DRAFT_17527 [Xylaria castorea]